MVFMGKTKQNGRELAKSDMTDLKNPSQVGPFTYVTKYDFGQGVFEKPFHPLFTS